MTTTLRKPVRTKTSFDQNKYIEYSNLLAAIGRAQAVIEFEMDGTIITANDNFLQALGYTLEEIRGRHHSLFVEDSEKNSPDYREFWARLNRGENLPGEYRRVGKGGKLVVIQASYNPIADASGKLVKVVKFASDVTEMAQARASEKQRAEEVARLLDRINASANTLGSSATRLRRFRPTRAARSSRFSRLAR